MADDLVITFDGGTATAVYDDRLLPTFRALGGELTVARASHVEPAPGGGWTADMAPVGGPVLGPFTTRAQALHEERQWLAQERGL